MNHTFKKIFFISIITALLTACSNEELIPYYDEEQQAGKIVIRGYNALEDSLQITVNGKLLIINEQAAFVKKIEKDHEFVYYNDEIKNIDIINKATGEILHSYVFTTNAPIDTLSFYHKSDYWIDNVLSFSPGTLSGTNRTGYRFIFPNLNRYSNSGYDGPLDGIIRKTNGQVVGLAEHITKDGFSHFVEFAYGPPPILNMELVKHGTTESYIPGQQVIVQIIMQNNKSRMIVLEEKAGESGAFTGVEGTINLVDYFDF